MPSSPPPRPPIAGAIDWKTHVRQHLAALGIDHTRHFTVVEELAQHLDDRHQSLLARGAAPSDAEAAVRQELAENDDIVRELQEAERRAPIEAPVAGATDGSVIESLWLDLRYAARALRKSPGFAAVAAITLALGVGANTAIFSVVNAVMLRPLPYPDPDRLVRIWESDPRRGRPQFSASHPNFLDWHAQATSWDALAAVAGANFSLTTDSGAQIVRGSAVSVEFLPALGIAPALGRNFRADEDRPGGDTRVAILTDGFWQRTFGGDPSVLGRTLSLNALPYTVIGVMPPTFDWGPQLELLVPLAADPARSRGDHRLTVIGRLKQGVSIDQAHNELATIAAALATQYPASNEGWTVRLASFYDWIIPGEIRDSLVVLLAAVSLVLLIACGNVANLLLARGAVRQKELSIRTALGASRVRIVRQLLLESVLLAIVAAGLGVLVTVATGRLIVAYGPNTIPRLNEVSIDPSVLAFAIGSALVSALVFGLLPALQASRLRPGDALQEASRGSSGGAGRQRLRSALTVAEVALSVSLLIAAGLLLRSFARLQDVNPGFDVESLMTMRLTLPRTTYASDDAIRDFYARFLPELRALPGIAGVALSSGVPLAGGNTSTDLRVPGFDPRGGAEPSADWRLVSPGYFAAMGIPLRGRDFTEQDRENTQLVTIISETMVRRYWPNEDPIGKTVVIGSFGNQAYTIVGVAGDVRSFSLDRDPNAVVYASTTAFPGWNPMSVVWRSSVDPASHVAAVREVVRRIDKSVPLYDFNALDTLLTTSFGPRRFNMYLLGCFAAVAVALAAIGLFGVMAYLVSQRTREIGVRLALGAARRDIFTLILGKGVALAAIGAVLGVAMAFWLTRAMQSLLFSVSPNDLATFVAVPLMLIIIAALACYIPARRAMRINPVNALRAE